MSRFRLVVLPFALSLVAGAGCAVDLTSIDFCVHSEGCSNDGGGWGSFGPSALSIGGVVTSATTGQSLVGVTVRIDAPVREWSETARTDSTGRYATSGLQLPKAGDCVGLSVTFSRDGFQPVRVTDFEFTCDPGYPLVDARLTPIP
jgi:hypothetical protein